MSQLSPALASRLQAAIRKHGLQAAEETILANSAECYAFVLDGPDDYRTVGNTRFGGEPDLPSPEHWPCSGDPQDPQAKFSNFIAQILECEFWKGHHVGQMLGFATSYEHNTDLYRQVHFGRIGLRDLMFNDYWRTMDEYEAEIAYCRDRGETSVVDDYEESRPQVAWLTDNASSIAAGAAEWRLLFRINSIYEVGLSMMDADPLYAFVRDADLAAGNFSNLAGEVTQG